MLDQVDVSLEAIYVAIVLALGSWTVWRLRVSLRRGEREVQERLAARKAVTAVPTPESDARPCDDVRARGALGIKARFSVHRRLLLPMVSCGVLVVAALPFLDRVPATALSLLIAVVTGVLGVAARPVLENAISGLVMSYSDALRIGDTVSLDGHYGTVEDISPTHTTIRVWDWRRFVVPNAQMLQSKLLNYSRFEQPLWAYVEFWVAYDSDLSRLREVALEVANSSPHNLGHEPAELWFMGNEPHGLKCWLAAWVSDPSSGWSFKDDVRGRLATRLREEGIATHGHRVEQRVAHAPVRSRPPEPVTRRAATEPLSATSRKPQQQPAVRLR